MHSSYTSKSEFYWSHLYFKIEIKNSIGSSWIERSISKLSY
nr:MAG TPA: hypothetical protein [Caudoviricetes sp.]